jgi:serine/threonine protein phosphatase 1
MPTIAIGDIHGNLAALENLLATVVPELHREDTLVFLGDYIDRGKNSRGCVERIVQLQEEAPCSIVALMGNHEQWMLRSLHNACCHSWLLGMEAFDTITSYSKEAANILREALQRDAMGVIMEKQALPYSEFFSRVPGSHLRFFEGLRLFHRTVDVTCAHGGTPLRGEEINGDPDVFIWGPEGFPDGYSGSQDVVYGHWNNAILDTHGWPGPSIKPNRTFGIDTISCGVLTAMRFPGGKLYQSKRFRSH